MTTLIRFFRERSRVSVRWLLTLAVIAGASNALVLSLLNAAAARAVPDHTLAVLLAALGVVMLVSVAAQRWLFETAAAEVEWILHRFRMEQLARVRCADLDALQRIGAGPIHDGLARQPEVLSASAGSVILGVQSAVVVLFALAYIAWLADTALALAVLVLVLGGAVYRMRLRRAEAALTRSDRTQDELYDALTDLVDGFKEVRLHAGRRAALAAFVDQVSGRLLGLRAEVETRLAECFLLLQATFYYAAAAMVFVLPGIGSVPPGQALQTMTAILFLIGPLTAAAASSSAVARARAACEALLALERRLAEAAPAPPPAAAPFPGPVPLLTTFTEIRLVGVVYQHVEAGEPGFVVGPVDLVLRRGDVLFISGGNGAGKSTLLRLLTALYRPRAGEVRVDGIVVADGWRDAYQNLFATVFADFHLFSRLHGLRHVAAEEVQRWLQRVELAGAVRLTDDRFESVRLSTGQRRRLALVVAALEDRPVYVFDEWAADQDPPFRRKFYEEILPWLQERGRTIVAVTHDERYLHRATRHLRMEEGRLLEVEHA